VDVMTVDRLARQKVLELAGLARIIAEARGRLIEAAQRRRAIELLRERRLEEWRQAADKRENDLLDELGSIAAGRRRSDSARDETPSETTP
jgi:flagellar export protein FliJ